MHCFLMDTGPSLEDRFEGLPISKPEVASCTAGRFWLCRCCVTCVDNLISTTYISFILLFHSLRAACGPIIFPLPRFVRVSTLSRGLTLRRVFPRKVFNENTSPPPIRINCVVNSSQDVLLTGPTSSLRSFPRFRVFSSLLFDLNFTVGIPRFPVSESYLQFALDFLYTDRLL
jgi:hypothetical protein